MIVPDVNIWGVLLATLGSMVVGSVWYARPVFGTYWMRTAGLDEKKMAEAGWMPLVLAILASFVTAWVLAGAASIAHEFYDGTFLVDCLVTALVLWLGFTAARFLTHDSFEGRPGRLTVLNVSHELVTVLVMALLIGLIGI